MSSHHRLAATLRLSISDLAGEALIMIGWARPWREEINSAFRQAHLAPRVSVETDTVASACGFAAEGFGIALVPEWLAASVPCADLRLASLDLTIDHEFVVVYPQRIGRRDLAEEFAEACSRGGRETLAELRCEAGTAASKTG